MPQVVPYPGVMNVDRGTRRRTVCVFSLAAILLVMWGCTARQGDHRNAPILVFAASSLAGPLDSVVTRFEHTHNAEVRVGYGASGTLAQQIRAGADADLYLSADTAWLQRLAADRDHPVVDWWSILSNHLVVAARTDDTLAMKEVAALSLPGIRRIAIADPQAAPAGRYAEAALLSAGLADAVRGKLVYADNVAATTNAIKMGAADVGLIYATDVRRTDGLKTILPVPDSLYPSIVYGLALLRHGAERPLAQQLARVLQSRVSLRVFQAAGFALPQGRSRSPEDD